MRRKDFSGDHVYIGAVASISCRIVCKLSGRKMSRSSKFVIRRVLVGGVGWVRGGMLDRSKLREDRDDPRRSKRGRSGDEGEAGEAVGDRDPAIFPTCKLVFFCCVFLPWQACLQLLWLK